MFDSWWLGPYRESRPIQQTAALDLLLAVVEEGVSDLVVVRENSNQMLLLFVVYENLYSGVAGDLQRRWLHV